MPIYVTKCKKCGTEADLILRINEELPRCDEPVDTAAGPEAEPCGGELEKIPSTSNFSFKGGAPTPRFY